MVKVTTVSAVSASAGRAVAVIRPRARLAAAARKNGLRIVDPMFKADVRGDAKFDHLTPGCSSTPTRRYASQQTITISNQIAIKDAAACSSGVLKIPRRS
ncbi:hypothetical protein Mame01_28920 [Microbispora amethystogenes]|nr:hypothetical protein Mame01_28920 [Microbispora amethystogenes]